MTDLGWLGVWLGVLAGGLGFCIAAHGLGLPTTYVRDLLHVGSGVWVLGWPFWRSPVVPSTIVLCALGAILIVPWLSLRVSWVRSLKESVSNDNERWSGIALYVVSYAALTLAGLTGDVFAAGSALLALSLGDGLGGAFGRRFGRHEFRLPWSKTKSLEGSAAVAMATVGGVFLASIWFQASATAWMIIALALTAAAAEALAPRASDNVTVPASVWVCAQLLR